MRWRRAAQAVLVFALLTAVVLFLIQVLPGFVGADHAFIVQSGSMEPAIMTGSTVFVVEESPEAVEVGDVITFRDDGRTLVTHRVVETHEADASLRFITKGDANDGRDAEPVYRPGYVGTVMEADLPIIGKQLFAVPYVGFVIAFGKTLEGWLVMVVLPAVALMASEVWVLYRAANAPETTHHE